MQGYNLFHHSGSRLRADGGLGDERQLLVEEQRRGRARARRFSQETNRRRKALDERQKQWDAQEQRLRQNILQQRRQRLQDATERFQRAHLPPSQRHRQSFRRNVPNIEDALSQIQGTLSSYTRQSSFLSSNSNISRSCTPSPRPPTVSKSSHRQALSAVEAYTKLLQEQSMTCLKNSQQAEKTQEKQQDHSPQDSRLSDCCNSESLSSKDSLENEDSNHSAKTLQCSYSSFFLDSEKHPPDLRKQNDLRSTSDPSDLHEPKQRKQEDAKGLNNKMHVSKASWGFTSVEQTPEAKSQPALHNCNLLTLCEIISSDPEHFEVNSPLNSPSDNICVPGNTAPQSSCPKQEALLGLRQQKGRDDRPLKHPSATEVLIPAKNGNSKDLLFEATRKPNIFMNDNTIDNAAQEESLQQTGKVNHYLSSLKQTSASINNLNKVSNSELETEKPINTAMQQPVCLSNIQSDTLKCLKCAEEEVQKLPHSVCEVRFIKGILKKQSKYMAGDTTCVYGTGHLIFTKQVALAIRDSVELTRARAKDLEGNSNKKKLRWFDEVQLEKEDNKQNIMKQMKSNSSHFSQSKGISEDHQLSLTAVSGASKRGPNMTSPASAGYHFTKQAWADAGVQVSLPQEQDDEVKVAWSSTRTAGPRVPGRERSATAGAGPVSSRTRKGTVMRPQSATEVNQIAKSQGKVMVPHPPPRMESVEEKAPHITKAPYGVEHASISCKQERAPHKDTTEGFLSPYAHHAIRTHSNVMYTQLPPSYTYPIAEGNPKSSPSSGRQETQGCRRRRGVLCPDKGLCSDCTPTDEEISHLWLGVRSALATKDAKAMGRRLAQEDGRVVRRACGEPPSSGNKRFPQPSQPTKQTTEPIRPFSSTYDMAFPGEGLESAAHLHLAEAHPGGLLEERNSVAAMETAQTRRPGAVQQCSQQKGLTTISLEEQKILLSLDRLNHQLLRVQEHVAAKAEQGLILTDAPSKRDVKVTNHHRQRASSANTSSRYQKKL